MTEAFAEIVAEAYERSGKTWEQLADETGLGVATVKRIAGRAGKSRPPASPNVDQLGRLTAVFGVSLSDWFMEAERRVKASDVKR